MKLPLALAASSLFAVDVLSAGNPRCNQPDPPVSQCREHYLPAISGANPIPPPLLLLQSDAAAAVKAERIAVENWLKLRAAHEAAKRKLEAASFSGRQAAQNSYDKARDDFRDSAQRYAEAKKATDSAADAAIRAFKAHFGLTPPKPDLNASQAADHDLAAWNPVFQREFLDKDIGRWRLRTPMEYEAEKIQAQSRSYTNSPPIGATSGLTINYDGQILLYPGAFESPESLLGSIHHETSHWIDIMAIGGTRSRRDRLPPAISFASERDAYAREAEFFRLSGDEAGYRRRLAVSERFEVQRAITVTRGLTWDAIAANQTYRGWLGVDAALRRAGFEEPEPHASEADEAIAEIRHAAETLRTRKEAEAEGRIHGDGRSLEEQEAKREVHVRMANAALGCGLSLEDTWNVRFRAGPNFLVAFQFKDEDSFKASLLLWSACYSASGSQPCVEAMETVKTKWMDSGFREKLRLAQGSSMPATECVGHLIQNLRRPDSFEDLLHEKRKFWDGYHRRSQTPAIPSSEPPRPPFHPDPEPPRERDPVPPREDIPWCMREDGRNCWHR